MKLAVGRLDDLVSEAEAIRFLGLHDRKKPKASIKWLVDSGQLPFVQVTPRIRSYRRQDLKAFVDARHRTR